jgi:anion-transporting  ArsA/GET3 family ATPase
MGPAARRVLLCVGPGGVGKTTCAAALALAAAHAGGRVCVVTLDPARRLAQALGLDPHHAGGEPVEISVDGPGTLHALLLDTRSVFDTIVRACATDPSAARVVLENRIYRATAERLGGALEYAAIAQVQILEAQSRWDLVVLDTPPTANAVQFLAAPARLGELVDNPAARLLAGTSSIGGRLLGGLSGGLVRRAFERIGGAGLLVDLGAFLRELSTVLREFQRRAGAVQDLLTSDRTGVVLATAANEFSVREAIAFLRDLEGRGLRVDAVVLNRFDAALPPRPDDALLDPFLEARAAAAGVEPAHLRDRFDASWAHARAGADQAASARARLETAASPARVRVAPRLDRPPEGLAQLAALGRALWGH